jgi:hypothetical protein
MIDQELRDLVASIAQMQAETARKEEKRAEERRKIEYEKSPDRQRSRRLRWQRGHQKDSG